MSDNVNQAKSLISVQTVIVLAALWGVVSLVIFLLGSPISPRPQWYGIATYALENLAFLGAALLCLRNWQSSQIVSGRGVWLLFAVGMMSYFTGNLILAWWELVWSLEPDVSPADFFYLLTYLVLGIGMLLAVVSKRLNLTTIQYAIVAAIAIIGLGVAYFVSYGAPEEGAASPLTPPQQTSAVQVSAMQVSAAIAAGPNNSAGQWLAQAAPQQAPTTPAPPAPAPAAPQAENSSPAAPALEPVTEPAAIDSAAPVPDWVLSLNDALAPLAGPVGLLYIAGDIFLLVMATTLLLAFWGGRFSMSWRFIAAAAFSFYIADSWFAYAIARFENYETGELPEVFWIFSAVLFSIGAALEYSLSRRSRRGMRRRA
ncbi:MAG: hypothetical protein ACFB5Z_20010 [Elainellaceae cyanobacterium]